MQYLDNGIAWKLQSFTDELDGLSKQITQLRQSIGEAESYYQQWCAREAAGIPQERPGERFDEARYAQRVQAAVQAFVFNSGLDRIASAATLVAVARALNEAEKKVLKNA